MKPTATLLEEIAHCRQSLLRLAAVGELDLHPSLLTVQDKWLLLQLNAAMTSASSRALKQFLHRDFSLWYLPGCKTTLAEATPTVARKEEGLAQTLAENALALTDFVFSQLLRLMNPVLPSLTDALWHQLGFHQDMPAQQGGESIAQAPRPKPLDEDELAYFGILPEDAVQATKLHDTVRLARRAGSRGKSAFLYPSEPLAEHEQRSLWDLLVATSFTLLTQAPAESALRTPLGRLVLE